jgi:hypothetical protein
LVGTALSIFWWIFYVYSAINFFVSLAKIDVIGLQFRVDYGTGFFHSTAFLVVNVSKKLKGKKEMLNEFSSP